MENCDNCKLEARVQNLEQDSLRNQGTHREFYTRFETIEKTQAVQDERYTNILKEINKIGSSIDELKSKPAKRWDGLVDKILLTIVAALVGFGLARLGLM